MAIDTDRDRGIPSASSPELLTRLVEHISEGIRNPRALAELLGLNLRTLQKYVHAGVWIGFLEEPEGESSHLKLTRLGLDYAFGDRRRERIWADAIWSQPFVHALMAHRNQDLPGADVVAKAILAQQPDLAPATVSRQASAVRSLVEPALRFERRRLRETQGTQLLLGFARPRVPVTQDRVKVPVAENEQVDDPAIYRVVLQALLDEGELSITHLRGVLDQAGGNLVPVGGYAEMAVRRGDASRWSDGVQDKLIATPGAIRRRDLSDTVASIALSDPEYREYLDIMIRTERGDPAAALRYGRLRARFAHWDRKLYGPSLPPKEIARSVERLLLGRPLSAFPLARPEPGGGLPVIDEAPFLHICGDRGLCVCLPPSLDALLGGVSAVNHLLTARMHGPQRVSVPLPVDPRAVFHGGLLHPGEKPWRAVPDLVTLRLLAISRIPYLCLLTAFLLLHRRSRGRLTLRLRGDGIEVLWRRRARGPLLEVLDRLMRARGWLVCRRYRGGLETATLKDLAIALGIASVIEGRLLLSEDLFLRMRNEAEDGELFERLFTLCNALEGELAGLADDDAAPEESDEP